MFVTPVENQCVCRSVDETGWRMKLSDRHRPLVDTGASEQPSLEGVVHRQVAISEAAEGFFNRFWIADQEGLEFFLHGFRVGLEGPDFFHFGEKERGASQVKSWGHGASLTDDGVVSVRNETTDTRDRGCAFRSGGGSERDGGAAHG